jgi:hypothetical protein
MNIFKFRGIILFSIVFLIILSGRFACNNRQHDSTADKPESTIDAADVEEDSTENVVQNEIEIKTQDDIDVAQQTGVKPNIADYGGIDPSYLIPADEKSLAYLFEPDEGYLATLPPKERERFRAFHKSEFTQKLIAQSIAKMKAEGRMIPDFAAMRRDIDEAHAARMAELHASIEVNNERRSRITKRREEMQRGAEKSREFNERLDAWFERLEEAKRDPQPQAKRDSQPQADHATWQEQGTRQILDIDSEIVRNYPTVTLAQYLTKKEFDQYFSTPESKTRIQVQRRQMESAFINKINAFLSKNVGGTRREQLQLIKETLSQNWNADLIDSIMKDLK